jgi:CspA family cold shock protein
MARCTIMDNMEQSTVKWFDAKKGYGFINHPDGGDDVFVHYSQIKSDDDFKTLHTGQSVHFELNDGPKGLHAVSVHPESDASEHEKESSVSGDGEVDSPPASSSVSIPRDASTPAESTL